MKFVCLILFFTFAACGQPEDLKPTVEPGDTSPVNGDENVIGDPGLGDEPEDDVMTPIPGDTPPEEPLPENDDPLPSTLPTTYEKGDINKDKAINAEDLRIYIERLNYPVYPDADFNRDGSVDSADYTIWRDTSGSTEDLRADADHNGVVDGADFLVWQRQFGAKSRLAGDLNSDSEVDIDDFNLWMNGDDFKFPELGDT